MNNAYDSVFIFVPEACQIIRISEGAGDNILEGDITAGYVDYIYYETHALSPDLPEVDGGMIMLTEMFQDKFKCTKEAIPAVLDMQYGNENLNYIVLEESSLP